jgi:hypothetical protein
MPACFIVLSPLGANAGQDNQKPAQPTAGKTPVVVEQVENGPAFGAEVKFTQVNDRDAVLLGGYAGALFDNTLLIGGVGYRVIAAANGFEDQIQGLTGSAAIRFGSGK